MSKSHKIPTVSRTRVCAISAALAAIASTIGMAVWVPSADAATAYVNDNFDRTVAAGLGTATLGGAYAYSGSGAQSMSVLPGKATIDGLAAGSSETAYLAGQAIDNPQTRVTVAFPAASTSEAGLTTAAVGRLQANGQSYRAKLTFTRNGKAALAISRTSSTKAETALSYLPLPWTLAANSWATVEISVTGNNPVVVQARAWPETAATPGWQLSYTDSSSAQITSAGTTGFWGYRAVNASANEFFVKHVYSQVPAASLSSGVAAATSASRAAASTSVTTTSSAPAPLPATSTSSSATAPSTSAPAPVTSMSSSAVAPASPSSVTAPPATTSSSTTAPSTAASTPVASTSTSTPPTTSTTPPTTPEGTSVAALTATAGATTPGTTAIPYPANAYFVSPTGSDSAAGTISAPWQTINYASSKAPAGATIVVRAGTYHESVTIARANQTIQAYPNEAVWLDGSSPVSNWVQQGSTWVHSNWNVQFDHSLGFHIGATDTSYLAAGYPMAGWPDQVFMDGTSLQQVAAGTPVGPGQFAVDYTADTLTIGSDPTGHQMSASDLEVGVTMQTTGQTLNGIGVRRFATPMPMMGAVRLFGGSDTLENAYVTQNSTQGVSSYRSNNVIDHASVVDNGMTGIQGNESDGLVISNTVSSDNNTEHFSPSPSTAGIKITMTNGLSVMNSVVADNLANGIWLDESDRQFKIVNNMVTNNRLEIQAELSDTGVIADNVLTGGEYGIWLHDTGNVQIFNNTISQTWNRAIALMQDDRRQATYAIGRDPRSPVPDPNCTWIVENIVISNNTFDSSGKWQVWVLDAMTHTPADAMNITITGNLFAAGQAPTSADLIGWGQSNNVTLTPFTSVTALEVAEPGFQNNMQTTTGARSAAVVGTLPVSDSNATPLPADVAALIGVAAGTQHLGAF